MEVGPGSGAGAGPGPGLKWWPPSAGATKVHAGRKPIIVCRKGGLTNITSHIQAQICVHGEGSSGSQSDQFVFLLFTDRITQHRISSASVSDDIIITLTSLV